MERSAAAEQSSRRCRSARALRLESERASARPPRRPRRRTPAAQADEIVPQAEARAARIRAESERELAAATQRRDSINAQLTNVRQMLATLSGTAPAAFAALGRTTSDAGGARPTPRPAEEADARRRARRRRRTDARTRSSRGEADRRRRAADEIAGRRRGDRRRSTTSGDGRRAVAGAGARPGSLTRPSAHRSAVTAVTTDGRQHQPLAARAVARPRA